MSEKKTTNKKLGVGVLLGFIVGCMVGCVAGGGNEKTSNVSTDTKKETVEETKSTEETKKETPKATKPVSLGAGEYIVGKDLPPGRYKVSGNSNFQVYGSSDKTDLKVNTILGNSSVGRGDYTFWAKDGDLIEAASKVKLTPVE